MVTKVYDCLRYNGIKNFSEKDIGYIVHFVEGKSAFGYTKIIYLIYIPQTRLFVFEIIGEEKEIKYDIFEEHFISKKDIAQFKIFHSLQKAREYYLDINKSICPKKGDFIGYKIGKYLDEESIYKLSESNTLITLHIPAEAKRVSNILSNKCRAEYAEVVDIKLLNNIELLDSALLFNEHNYINQKKNINKCFNYFYYISNKHILTTEYKIGKTIYSDFFDDSIYKICAHGIHFFMTKQEAIEFSINY